MLVSLFSLLFSHFDCEEVRYRSLNAKAKAIDIWARCRMDPTLMSSYPRSLHCLEAGESDHSQESRLGKAEPSENGNELHRWIIRLNRRRIRVIGLGIVAVAILSWWVSTLVLRPAGYGWYVFFSPAAIYAFDFTRRVAQTVIAWFSLMWVLTRYLSGSLSGSGWLVESHRLIASRIIPNIFKKWTSRMLSVARYQYWDNCRRSWLRIPYIARLAFGWLVVVGIFLSLLFGFRSDSEASLFTTVVSAPLTDTTRF